MSLVLVTDEAANAIKRKPPTDKDLIKMLNGYEENSLPSSEQVRWLAAFVLTARGHVLNRAPRKAKV